MKKFIIITTEVLIAVAGAGGLQCTVMVKMPLKDYAVPMELISL